MADYTTKAKLKRFINIKPENTNFDTLIDELIDEAEAEIDFHLEPYTDTPLSTVPAIIGSISKEYAAGLAILGLWQGKRDNKERAEFMMEHAIKRLKEYIHQEYVRQKDEKNRGFVKVSRLD